MLLTFRSLAMISLVLAACAPSALRAQETATEEPAGGPGVLTFQIENDVVSNTDKDYTNGVNLQYLSPEVGSANFARSIAENVPLIDLDTKFRYGIGIGQSIFTPRDKKRRNPDPTDRPYAGWLYVSFSFLTYDDTATSPAGFSDVEFLQRLALDVGVVGPAALGEQVQNEFHSLIGVDEANGWNAQINNEPGIMLSYERKWREVFIEGIDFGIAPLDFEIMPHIGGALGNVLTYGATGASVRLGQGLRGDFGPPRIRPSLPGSGFFRPGKFGWYLFAGAEGRAVARNIFLDGNTFRDSRSVDKNVFVGDLQAGVALNLWDVRISYTQVFRTAEGPSLDAQRFGSLAVSWGVDF